MPLKTSRFRPLRRALTLALTLFPVILLASDNGDAALPAWEKATSLFIDDALKTFEQLEASPQSAREGRYGQAIMLLNVQPKNDSNLDRAVALLEEVRKENAKDELGLAATYFLGRIAEEHRREVDIAGARKLYGEAAAERKTLWGQLAYLRLFQISIRDAEGKEAQQAVIDQYAKEAETLSNPAVRRNLYFVLGEATQFYELPLQPALDYFERARAIGFEKKLTQAQILLRTARLAERMGQEEKAYKLYAEFVAKYPRHSSTHMLEEKIAARQ